MKKFKKICMMEQMELKKWLERLLKAKYRRVENDDGFLYAKGNVPILLTAHMDTVHKDKCTEIKVVNVDGQTVLSSPQGIGGDDRCGIWIIYKILTKTKYRPSILFCEDEEIGGVGSNKFAKTVFMEDLKELKYLVELDRMNSNDAVYYSCGNYEFMEYIATTIGYKEAYGSFSDIGHLSPGCDRASVNLSCGYYRQHTLEEYVIFEEMFDTFKAVEKLLADANNVDSFDYEEEVYGSYSYFKEMYRRNRWYDDDTDWFDKEDEEDKDDVSWDELLGTRDMPDYKDGVYEFIYNDKNFKEQSYVIEANSFEEAIGMFLIENPNVCYNDIIDYYQYVA